jgi:hypothetical protein
MLLPADVEVVSFYLILETEPGSNPSGSNNYSAWLK